MVSSKDAWNDLYKRHWSLVPLKPDKKCYVSWRQYQTQRAQGQTIREWLKEWPDANPGVVTGRISGIVVIDVDGPDGIDGLRKAGITLKGPVVETARGYHYYFAYPDIPEGKHVITKAGIFPHVDVRGDGGYVVGPGGTHATGSVYKWQRPPDGALPQLPPQLLDIVVSSEPDPLQAVKPLQVPQDRQNGHAREWALAALDGEVMKVQSAPDGTKHDRLLASACALGGLIPAITSDEIETALYNAVVDRAKDRRAARITIRDGISYGLSLPREIPPPSRNGKHRLDDILPPMVKAKEQQNGATDKPRYKSLDDYLSEPIPVYDWLCEDLLVAGGASLLAARPKVGKSKTARTLCVNVARGERFLRRECRQGPVVYLALEEKAADVLNDFKRMGGAGLPIYPFFDGWPARPADRAEWLRQVIIDLDAVLVVIDPAIMFFGFREEPRYSEVYAAMMPIVQVARDTGAHIMFLMHLGKPSQAEQMSEEVNTGTSGVMGSQAYTAVVDATLIMKRSNQDNTRTIYSEQRTGQDMPVTVLRMDLETSLISVEGTLHNVKLFKATEAITRHVRTFPGASEKDITENAGVDTGPIPSALRAMLDEGQIIRTGSGGKKDPFRYYLPPFDSG